MTTDEDGVTATPGEVRFSWSPSGKGYEDSTNCGDTTIRIHVRVLTGTVTLKLTDGHFSNRDILRAHVATLQRDDGDLQLPQVYLEKVGTLIGKANDFISSPVAEFYFDDLPQGCKPQWDVVPTPQTRFQQTVVGPCYATRLNYEALDKRTVKLQILTKTFPFSYSLEENSFFLVDAVRIAESLDVASCTSFF